MPSDELVSVMVPKRHLARVYGLIARLEGDATTADSSSPASALMNENGNTEWTQARLRRMVQESPPAVRDILRILAEHADEWLATQQLAEAIQENPNANWQTVAGTMGAFGRRVKNRYGIESFPFEKRYDHAAHSSVFRMSRETAQLVLELLNV